MSQPLPSSDFNPQPKRETARLASVPDVPTGGLGGRAIDPAQEIGNLINQLQSGMHEARQQIAQVEHERDELRVQLIEARTRLDEATERLVKVSNHDAETREKFVEVTSVIRERDELLESVDLYQKSIAELQRRIDAMQKQEMDLQRQRGAVIIERDRALKERGTYLTERDEARGRLAETQRHTVSLRQARDAAQSQCHDLQNKVCDLEDQVHELTHDLRDARAQSPNVEQISRERDEAVAARQQLTAQLEQITRELETQRQQITKLTEQQSQLAMSDTGHASALAEARQEVLKLTQERDAARIQAQDHWLEIDRLRAHIEMTASGATLPDAVPASPSEREALLEQDLAGTQKSRDAALVSLQAAQKQIEYIARERDLIRQQGIDRSIAMEEEHKAALEKAGTGRNVSPDLELRLEALARERDQALEKAHNFEGQRLASIDLAAQLDAARREIRTLTADLAEARLEAKAHHAHQGHHTSHGHHAHPLPGAHHAKQPPPLPAKAAALHPDAPAPAVAKPAKPVAATPAPAPELDDDVLSEKEAKGLLTEIKKCHLAFSKTPTDFSLLNELHCQLQHFAERARVSGFLGIYRISRAFSNLAQDLYRYPEQVNPSTMRTINLTTELIGTLLKQKNYAALKDPARATVFAVDDDADNCDAIRMAMESIGMRTRSAQEPAVALAEMAADHYDLIFLDVALPHMDGFELCQHIRELPNHVHTPVVFLTGLTTIENRVQSSLSGGNDFVGKPFNLHELALKAVALVLKSSLHLE